MYWIDVATPRGQRVRSWQETVVRFINDTQHKASHKTDLFHLKWLDRYLSTKNLSDINRDFVDYLKQSCLNEGVSNASLNRILSLELLAILSAGLKLKPALLSFYVKKESKGSHLTNKLIFYDFH